MARIVSLDFHKARAVQAPSQTTRDPFDVVVFLDHFQNIDSLSDGLSRHFEPTAATETTTVKSREYLVMQTRGQRLAVSLGRQTR